MTEETSFHRLSSEARLDIRKRAIRMWRHGASHVEIIQGLKISKSTLERTITAWKRGGQKALAGMGGKGGRPVGACKVLPAALETQALSMIADHSPDEYGVKGSLWGRDALKALAQERLGVCIGLTTAGLYLRRWRLDVRKPERLPGQWMRELKSLARSKGAEVFYVETKPFRKGVPAQNVPPLNMVGAVNPLGTARFSLRSGTIDSDAFVDFASRLLEEMQRPLALVVDGQLAAHRSAKTRKWIDAHKDMVSLYFLPERRISDERAGEKAPDSPGSEA